MVDDDRAGPDRAGWLLPGVALLIAAGLLVWTLLPRGPAPAPSPIPSLPTPTPSDEHEVVTDEGMVSFHLEGEEIVVRLTTAAGTAELGRAPVLGVSTAPPGGSPSAQGSTMFAMACGGGGAPTRRYVFGHLDATSVTYSGPQALGQVASDGLFLYALLPGVPDGAVLVKSPDTSAVGFGAPVFATAAAEGTRQPSGCFVVG